METKICTRCKEDKPLEEFGWRRKSLGLRHYQCVLCMRLTAAENYQRNKVNIKRRVKENKKRHRDNFQEWKKTLSCGECGESEPCCLEFHHLDPTKKDRAVSALVSWSFERVKKEAEQCVILCSNCHRKLHAGIIMVG